MRVIAFTLFLLVGCSSEQAPPATTPNPVETCRPELHEGDGCTGDLLATCKCDTQIPSYVTICCRDGHVARSLNCSDFAGGPTCYHAPVDSGADILDDTADAGTDSD